MATHDEIWELAVAVFGSEDDAKAWMSRPAIGLNYQKPEDVMATHEGSEKVRKLLTRIERGVYI